ncbi:MAG: bifunctional phosphopantothenoylcysteine decarboxylase/phosphopantothenate--cysteine ligase CoaBC [Bryobacterales bacterium]|nr:bifunctional phosphopantothenoylcysteine decarboxylase/phosphopantothenate--cysteine ligase CoaBC [Bryobacterales bacterium]
MKIALGVGGGIAAYKSADLARRLMEHGHQVEAILTSAAQQFIQPLTLAALTGRKVITDLFEMGGSDAILASAIEHIRVAQENDLLLVAPATADLIAKFASGLAPDFLSTAYLAFTGPVILAPAMNTNMWEHPATQANLETLRSRGNRVVPPGSGLLACGMVGVGRLAEIDAIVREVQHSARRRQDLAGDTVLVTAGPTQEPLDPVRFLTNRSSGKMGYALAEAAAARGARVILISGPVSLSAPAGVETIRVRTARQMRDAVIGRLGDASIIIKAAAVADYYVESVPEQKIKKSAGHLVLELDRTPDILAEVGRRRTESQLVIGFAAETQDLVNKARAKLSEKNCDIVVGNLVGDSRLGFDTEENEVTLVTKNGDVIPVDAAPKQAIAHLIYDEALRYREARSARVTDPAK